MAEVMYNPSDVGKEVTNIRGNKSIIRKYHMTEGEKLSAKANWDKEIEHVDSALKLKAGALFFNPYRKGIYYYQLYALFMLGCNEWHIVNDVITKVEEVNGKLAVTGNLQIKNVTKSITIPAIISVEAGITTFKSDVFNVDRADFNVKYGSKRWIEGLKDKFIDDLVEMSFVVKTTK